MLTIIGCKLPSLSFYDRAQFMKDNEAESLRYDLLPTDDAVFIGENYSPKYHTRHIKKEDSYVQWSTGLLKVPKWHDIEANFNLLSYGKENVDWEANFVWYKESKTPEIQESVKYEVAKVVPMKRELNFDVTSPQSKANTAPRWHPQTTTFPKVSNFEMFPKAQECFPLGPSPSAKVICDDDRNCRTVCRRRFTMKGSLKKLRCENGFWISDNDQPLNELYMYFMLNYLCMPKDVAVEELVRKYKETHDNLIEPEDPFE
ncbi:unnamed protein product [Oikopleura dioica]|uniref:Uncharacterized protein n=1 Tax=Oikopleura dioica TaxID=34765 RepID=E4XGR2_OIKDI|nr:unnamed protein product [Oikopleura dioica]